MKRVYRYLGMSGSLKATTIMSMFQGHRRGYTLPVWSTNKFWKKLEGGMLRGFLEIGNDLLLGTNYLCNLQNILQTATLDEDIEFILVERGILDYLWYWCKKRKEDYSRIEPLIKNLRKEEKEMVERMGFKEMRNTILIMEDRDFINDRILLEPSRREWFPDVDAYLSAQSEYVNFIETYIGDESIRVRLIPNAKKYIEEQLKLEYK